MRTSNTSGWLKEGNLNLISVFSSCHQYIRQTEWEQDKIHFVYIYTIWGPGAGSLSLFHYDNVRGICDEWWWRIGFVFEVSNMKVNRDGKVKLASSTIKWKEYIPVKTNLFLPISYFLNVSPCKFMLRFFLVESCMKYSFICLGLDNECGENVGNTVLVSP